MIDDASKAGQRIGLIATFAPTLQTLPGEFPSSVRLKTAYADGALAALDRGDGEAHVQIVVDAALRLVDCTLLHSFNSASHERRRRSLRQPAREF
ncbi:hypothetical protein [Neorhizobium tomejilense]|uniref:hypothetical protein n=1 Tax=Neorhizobium tomejilense TaxID=2093828 RepID=UPI003F4FEEA4